MSYLSNLCPKCNNGPIFKTFLRMNRNCPHCHHRFEREPGYFTGAMFLDCIILPISGLPVLIALAYNGLIVMGGFFCLLQIILTSPIVFRYSRILWIRAGYELDPDSEASS